MMKVAKKNQRKPNYPDSNIEDIFWDISMGNKKLSDVSHFVSRSKTKEAQNKTKYPMNFYTTFKHVSALPKKLPKTCIYDKQVEENHMFEDLEDVYEDWASISLSDERYEKKIPCLK